MHVQFLWQQSAASDCCNHEWQHTLGNCCSQSSAVSSALCCCSRSLLLRSLSCHTVSAQVLRVLSMMNTTARANCKKLSADSSMQKQAGKAMEMATTIRGLCSSYGWQLYCDESCGTRRPLCLRKSTLHPIVASGSPFEVCPNPDTTPCAKQPSLPVQMC